MRKKDGNSFCRAVKNVQSRDKIILDKQNTAEHNTVQEKA